MLTMKLSEISMVCSGRLVGDGSIDITNITTDSRTAKRDGLFAALVGERTDGHKYIKTALDNGAAAVICEKQPTEQNIISWWTQR